MKTITNREKTYSGAIFNVEKRRIKNPMTGEMLDREVVLKAPVVVIVAYDTKTKEVLITKEYRAGVDEVSIGLPAGFIDEGETPKEAAIRELKEETGYNVEEIKFLTCLASSQGFTNEISHIYFAEISDREETSFDDGEFIETERISWDNAMTMVLTNEIKSAQAVSALLFANTFVK